MQALLQEENPTHRLPNLEAWLQHGRAALEKFRKGNALDPSLSPHNQLSQLNVLEQMEHLKSFPEVRDQIKSGELRIHGWWFDIRQADVYAYEQQENRFLLIDEAEAGRILKRLEGEEK